MPVAVAAVGLLAVILGVRIAVARRRPPNALNVLFMAGGLFICGVSGLLAAGAWQFAPDLILADVPLPAELPLIGLFFTVGLLLPGLFLMPGLNATYVGRLRRAADGAGVGVWAFLVAWLLIFENVGLKGAGLTAVLLSTVAVSASAVGTLRATRFHPGAFATGAGVTTTIVGQTGLVLALDYHAPPVCHVIALALLIAGPIVTTRALGRLRPVPAPVGQPVDDGSFAGYPLLALPLGGALVASLYHLVTQHSFDRVSVTVGIVGVSLIALREFLAMIDVRRYANALAEREEHFRALVDGSSDVTLVLDADFIVRWQSPAAARQFGLSDQDVVGRWSLSDQRAVPAVDGIVLHVRDVGERNQLQRELHRVAFVDRLTGLSNGHDLRRELAAGNGNSGVLIVLGLFGLTGVNQVRGLEVGDAVLVEAARRLRASAPSESLVARLGEDRFAVLADAGAVQAQLLATRLVTVLSEPYSVGGVESHVSANAGLAECTPDLEALNQADLALQRARRSGAAGPPQWYDEATEAALRRRLTLEQELPGAVPRGELDVVYQPIVQFPGQLPVGVEALPCWRHPALGTIATAELRTVAHELGIEQEITEWALRRACRQLAEWQAEGRELWLAFDVPLGQLAAPAFVPTFSAVLESYGVPASRLVVEFALPEGAEETPGSVPLHLQDLRALGVRTALTRFGAQATSLRRLRLLPLDVLKLDPRLLDASGPGTPGAVVGAVVDLARQLGVVVGVQGVQNQVELDEAVAAGCQLAQGVLCAAAAPPERVEAYLDTFRKTRF
jgi:diguanylate cyclase (GGDEF)-like protein